MVLLGATALVGFPPIPAAHAQFVIDENGPDAPDRGPGGFDADGDNGDPGGSITNATPGAVNNVPQINVNASGFGGTANGGDGGDGGEGLAGTPFETNGGEGGNGGVGGSVDVLNNATISTIGSGHHGLIASAVGGDGGSGGGALPAIVNLGGDAGSGSTGGSANA
ncbi:hypothetical protein EN920_34255, partial [Mesorhizobium sp. M7A.F.Ca.CA.004.09.1.2]